LRKDRLMAGAISGVTGAIVQILFELLSKTIGFTDRDFVDMAKMFIMYKRFPGIISNIIGVTAQLLIGAGLGIGFAYLIRKTSSRYYFIKGFGYGAIIWLIFATLGSVFKMPLFTVIPPNPALSLLFGALVYGFFTSFTLQFLEKKSNLV
jgi:riboflavin transporter FmnP